MSKVERCHFCLRLVLPDDPELAELVTGWVERRRGGGAHGVRLMSMPQALAHKACLDREIYRRSHGGRGQGELL